MSIFGTDEYRKEISEAEEGLLKFLPKDASISSHALFQAVQILDKKVHAEDTLRMAYWGLVGQGKIIRTPQGVRRGPLT